METREAFPDILMAALPCLRAFRSGPWLTALPAQWLGAYVLVILFARHPGRHDATLCKSNAKANLLPASCLSLGSAKRAVWGHEMSSSGLDISTWL